MTTESGPNYDPFQGGGSHRSMVIECEVDDLGNMLRRALGPASAARAPSSFSRSRTHPRFRGFHPHGS